MTIKKIALGIVLATSTFLVSCEKADEIVAKETKEEEVAMPPAAANVLYTGAFTGASGHTTTGTAQIVKVDDTTNSLVFTSFKTDSGPDLRVYLAEDLKANNFVEITDKVENGNKTYVVPSNVDLSKQKFVLIWCKAFSVNFGYVELKTP